MYSSISFWKRARISAFASIVAGSKAMLLCAATSLTLSKLGTIRAARNLCRSPSTMGTLT